jgi:CDP-6-deoxy-D-xylo-4-hexulose-3-dehydrase
LGNPPDIDRLIEIKNKYNIQLLLDGCDSLGTKWKDRLINEYFTASTCSFYPAHHITTGEGGMVSSNNEELIKLARVFSWWGRDCYCVGSANLTSCGACGKRFSNWIEDLPYPIDHKYYFSQIGYNLKPLDLQGGIGIAQLKKADQIHNIRKQNKNKIQNLLQSISGLSFPSVHSHANVSWFGVPVMCKTFELKQSIVTFLEQNKIQTRNYFAGNILLHPAYRHLGDWKQYPNASSVLEKVFFLGCSPVISEKHIHYMSEVIEKYKKIGK